MKKYIATWNHYSEIFSAKNIKEAKKFAQTHKRRNGYVGITIVKPTK